MNQIILLTFYNLKNSIQIIKSNNYFERIPIISRQDTNLWTVNVGDGQNDKQIKNVRDLLTDKFRIDPFHNLLSNKSN